MKRIVLILTVIVLMIFGGCAKNVDETPNEGAQGTQSGTPISCMSFNILAYNTGGTEYPEPEDRYKAIIPYILEQNADIVGIQEASRNQGFDWPGKIVEDTKSVYAARRVDEEYEYGAKQMDIAAGLMILYRADRFELLESGTTYFWEDGGRWYQWIKLKDKKAGKDIFVTNTHWSINPMLADGSDRDYEQGDFLRCSEAEELVTFWEETVGDAPLFATGDYNCVADSDPHLQYLQRGIYRSVADEAIESDGETTVDFIYCNPNKMAIDKYEMMPRDYTFEDGTTITMSDHCSVMCWGSYK